MTREQKQEGEMRTNSGQARRFGLSFRLKDEAAAPARAEALVPAQVEPAAAACEPSPVLPPTPAAPGQTGPDYRFATLSGCLALATPAVLLLLWVAEAVWRPLGTPLYLILMGISFAIVSDTLLSKQKRVPDAGAQAFSLAAMLVILVAFSQLSRHYYIRHGGFDAANASYWHWLRYGADAVANALLRGIPQLWNWSITEIKPVGFWPRVMLLLFQLAADVLAIGGLFAFVGKLFAPHPKKAPAGGNYLSHLVRGFGQILGLALWGIPLAMGIDATLHDAWNPAAVWPAVRTAAPVMLGAWLLFRSLGPLAALRGALNKLGAAAGTGAALWMLWSSWPAIRAFLER